VGAYSKLQNGGISVNRGWVLSVVILLSSLSYGQTRMEVSHPMREVAAQLQVRSAQATPITTLRVLAIMVEFQTDHTDQTTGDGSFQITGSAEQIDPPPHDSTYFKNKIRFVENYFRKVSNGNLTVAGLVLPQKIVLSKPMAEYSPPKTGTDNRKLAGLAIESWQRADSLHPEIDFSAYDVFVVFHAGAGRDIDLVSISGIDPTPYDIPSLYLDSTAFASALGLSSFSGIAVNGAVIKNTIILPETESRDISGTPLQLSMNGLFAASLGSFLGLPDLFDTKTGRSGIGQFGLMDGADIFAYSGLFPPEPSAWEKIYLGWVVPRIVQSPGGTLTLPAVGLTNTGQDVICKIPISQSEYFLLENRNRDPEGNGQTVTIAKNGIDISRHFEKDTIGFFYNAVNRDSLGSVIDFISGSLVDAENFDWALIGEMDGSGKYDGGGILIWHIDENIIQAGLRSNTVNADINHRGVALMEADGSKDIGQIYEDLTPGSGTENGSPLDCWFAGNPGTFYNNIGSLYKNIFDQNSFPNSNSNSGAASLITIKDFSARSATMTATVEIGSALLKRDGAVSRMFTHADSYPTSTKNHHLYFPAHDSVFAFQSNGRSLTNDASGLISNRKSDYGVAVYEQSTSEIAASVHDSALTIIRLDELQGPKLFDTTRVIGRRFSTSPCFLDSLSLLAGTESGVLYTFNLTGDTLSTQSFGTASISSLALLPVSSGGNEYFVAVGNRIYSKTSSNDLPSSSNSWILAATVSPKGNYVATAERNGHRLAAYNQSLSQKLFDANVFGAVLQEIAAADIDGDGEKDILVQSSTHLSAFNRTGILLDGFPIQVSGTNEFTGTPLVIDFNGDGKLEIIVCTLDGELWVYNRNGKLLPGFPIQGTSPGIVYPMAYTDSVQTEGIAFFSEQGSLDAFLTSTIMGANSFVWSQHLGDERHSNTEWTQTVSIPISPEFFPKSLVYNWPNPVYGRSTQIRYYTAEDANVTVTIIDLTGVKITELKGRGTAGMDSEISWNVSNIQSGIYLARIEAQGATHSETTVIKIAVVK
jgi:M6 family metalloprotease-like protein